MTRRADLTQEDASLAAEYALGLLQGDEHRAFEAALRTNPVLLGEVQDWMAYLSQLSEDIAVRPPARVKRKLMRRLFGGPTIGRRAFVALAVLGGAMALAVWAQK